MLDIDILGHLSATGNIVVCLLTGSILCMFWLRTIHDMVFVKSELLQNQKAFSVPSKLVPKALSDIQQHLKPYLSEKHQIGQSFTFGQSGYPQVFERDAMRDVDLSGLSLDMGGKRTTHSILKNTRTFSKNAVNSPFGFTRYSPNVNYDTTAPKETNYRSFTSLSDSDQPIFKGQRLFPKEELTGLEQLLAAKVTLKEPKKTWLWS